jgi:hypothetical protein
MVTVVQLISLLYKDRPVEIILQILDENCTQLEPEFYFDKDQQNQFGIKIESKWHDNYVNCFLPAPIDKCRRSSRQSTSSGFHSEDSNAPKMTSPKVTDSVMRKSNQSKSSSGSQSSES